MTNAISSSFTDRSTKHTIHFYYGNKQEIDASIIGNYSDTLKIEYAKIRNKRWDGLVLYSFGEATIMAVRKRQKNWRSIIPVVVHEAVHASDCVLFSSGQKYRYIKERQANLTQSIFSRFVKMIEAYHRAGASEVNS